MNEQFPKQEQEVTNTPHEHSPASFEEVFEDPEKISFQNGTIEVFDFDPGPEKERENTPPVLFVPGGLGATPRSYKESIKTYFDAGRRTISISFSPESTGNDLGKEDAPDILTAKANAILAVLKDRGVNQVDVIAHSEGCMNAILAAAKNAKQFRHFVFVAPPGLTGKESYLKILKKALQNIQYSKKEYENATTEERARIDQKKDELKEWLNKRGTIKGAVESMTPGLFEVDELVRTLQAEDNGNAHGISIIAGVDDKMLPIEKFQSKNASELGIDGFYSVSGGHSHLFIQPGKYAHAAESALEALENKYEHK